MPKNEKWRKKIIRNAIIKSVQANSLYCVNNEYKNAKLDLGEAVINDSLFLDYMKKHGVTINKKGKSKDFIVMKFDYGVKDKISAKDLRKYYYTNGATVVWETYDKEGNLIPKKEPVHYKMLMRNPGKAKEGECIFIKENFYAHALKYITMDLFDKMPEDNAQIVEMSAYSTLATATAIGYLHIPLKNMLIVEDEEVSQNTKSVAVKTHAVAYEKNVIDWEAIEKEINDKGFTFKKKKSKTDGLTYITQSKKSLTDNGIAIMSYPTTKKVVYKNECYVDRTEKEIEVKNVLWDGMGLIDESIFPADQGMEGFVYCRSHFFKSCLFRGNIQDYFKDFYGERYDKATIKDMFGNVKKVKDIKVIVTNNSIKWLKFKNLMGDSDEAAYNYYKKFMKQHGDMFEIIKTAHSSKWGDLQRSSYQINNSLPCTDMAKLKNIAKESVDYCNALKTDHDAFIKHLDINKNRYNINGALIALDEWNYKFKNTRYFKEKKDDIISRFKNERLKQGKLLQHGDNLTICGNPIALLKKATGQENFLDENCFTTIDNGIQCYTTRFENGERLAAFRSPHNSPNNIVHLVNVYPMLLQKYFPQLGNNVIVINGIKTDIQSRLNGQDLDSDSVYVTNQPEMAEIAEYAYINYPTIINEIKLRGSSNYKKDMESYAEMDNRISSAQQAIGSATNKAQLALCYYYDSDRRNMELEDVFIICSVLAQVAIDSAKREFYIDVGKELYRLGKLPCMQPLEGKKYPVFYEEIQKKKPNYNIKDSQVREFNCPMEMLAKIIEQEVIDKRKYKELQTDTYSLNEVFRYDKTFNKIKNGKQEKKVISIVSEYDKEIKELDKTAEDYHKIVNRKFERCMESLKNLTIKEATMASLIAYAFTPNNDIRDRLLTVLYDKNPKDFLNCFEKLQKVPENL